MAVCMYECLYMHAGAHTSDGFGVIMPDDAAVEFEGFELNNECRRKVNNKTCKK